MISFLLAIRNSWASENLIDAAPSFVAGEAIQLHRTGTSMRRNISCTMRNSISIGITKDIETMINASVTAVSLAKNQSSQVEAGLQSVLMEPKSDLKRSAD